MNPIEQALLMLKNTGKNIDQGGASLYNGIRGATMGMDRFLGLPDSRQAPPTPQNSPVLGAIKTIVGIPGDIAAIPGNVGNGIQNVITGISQQSPLQNPLGRNPVEAETSPTPQVLAAQIAATPTKSPQNALPTGIPGVSADTGKQFTDILNNHILPITRQYGIPDAVTAAQAAQESGYGKSAKNNNYFGLMHFDQKTGQRSLHTFDTPEDAATFYAQTVRALVPNLDQIKGNPMQVLQSLQGHGKTGNYEGDNPNPQQYVYDVSNNPTWQAYGGGKPMQVNPQGWTK